MYEVFSKPLDEVDPQTSTVVVVRSARWLARQARTAAALQPHRDYIDEPAQPVAPTEDVPPTRHYPVEIPDDPNMPHHVPGYDQLNQVA